MSKTAYALQVDENAPQVYRQSESPLRLLSVAATVLACVAIVLGSVALNDNKTLDSRVSSSLDHSNNIQHADRHASMVQSALAAHPNCTSNLQSCIDLMNITSWISTRNLTSDMFASSALRTKNIASALFTADGTLLAGHKSMVGKHFEMPNADFSNCAMTHGHTCIMARDGKLATFSRIGLTNLPEGMARRDWASGMDQGFQYGKDGAEFGAAIGGAIGTLAGPGVGSAIGGAVGGLVGGAAGFGAGMYEGW